MSLKAHKCIAVALFLLKLWRANRKFPEKGIKSDFKLSLLSSTKNTNNKSTSENCING